MREDMFYGALHYKVIDLHIGDVLDIEDPGYINFEVPAMS
jgi:hypothetical protein